MEVVSGKTCSKCGEYCALDFFHADARSKGGRVARCKKCVRIGCREHGQRVRAAYVGHAAEKRCSRCESVKSSDEFSPNRYAVGGLQPWCKACRREGNKKWGLKFCYGLSLEQLEELIRKQCGKCAICRNEFENRKATHVDHCHRTGVIRGVLCQGCNTGIGQFKDNPDALKSAAEYLLRNRGDES